MPKCRTRKPRKPSQDDAAKLILANLSPAVRAEGLASDCDDDGMNKTERAYAARLEAMKRAGEILEWQFEPFRLRLGDLKRGRRSSAKGRKEVYYTPDFLILMPDRTLVIHEIKGRETTAEMARFKVAASIHHYRFVLVKRDGQNWTEETFEAEGP